MLKEDYPSRFHSKASGECYGGGGVDGSRLVANKAKTTSNMIHEALTIISLDHSHKFKLLKDRSEGTKGEISIDKAIEKMADMLAKAVFTGTMDMFQETMKMKLVECINGVISGDNIIPEGNIDENSVQRESRSNGTKHNTLLQRFVQLRR